MLLLFASELQGCSCSAIKLFLNLACRGDFESLNISKIVTGFIHLDRYAYVFKTSISISVAVGIATHICIVSRLSICCPQHPDSNDKRL